MKTLDRLIRKMKEQEAIEDLKSDLAAKHKLERNRKFDLAWNIAWDQGHSCGLDQVVGYFEELVPLIKP